MLTLYAMTGQVVPLKCDDYYVRHIANGEDELVFNISIWDESYPMIVEEARVLEMHDDPIFYKVVAIDGGGQEAKVKCVIDLDDWRSHLYYRYHVPSGGTPASIMALTIINTSPRWRYVDNSGITDEFNFDAENLTPLQVLEEMADHFPNLSYRFDNYNRVVTMENIDNGVNLGSYITRDLNLQKVQYKGKSNNLVTRLYATGKDGLRFGSVNGGVDHIDDFSYTSEVICANVEFLDIEDPQELLDAARAQLAILAKPERSYNCDVYDLASANPGQYDFLAFKMFSVITLIDETRSDVSINLRVVELWDYPYYPEKNKVILSSVAPRLQTQLQTVTSILRSIPAQTAASSQGAAQTAVNIATGITGGHVLWQYDNDNKPSAILFMDTTNATSAQKVIKCGQDGLSFSTTGVNGPFTPMEMKTITIGDQTINYLGWT